MDTQKAIDRIENLISWKGHDVSVTKYFVEDLKDIIAVLKVNELKLKEGKAYKNIYGKIKKEYGSIMKVDFIHYSSTYLSEVMEELEQKYFPTEETYKGVPVSKIKVGLTD